MSKSASWVAFKVGANKPFLAPSVGVNKEQALQLELEKLNLSRAQPSLICGPAWTE